MKNLKLKSSALLAAMTLQSLAMPGVLAEEKTISAKLSMLDGRGNYMENLSGASKLYGKLELSNVPGEAQDVIIGAYDEAGRLVAAGKTELAANETTAEFSFDTSGEQSSVQAFVWNKNQKPLINKVNVWNVTTKGLYEWFGLAAQGEYQTTSDNVSVNWFWSASEDGEYSVFAPAIDENLIFNNGFYADKWIKFRVTADGVVYESEPRRITYYPKRDPETIDRVRRTTPDEYVFEVDGTEFVLLGETDSDTAKFKIISRNTMGDAVSYCPYFNPVAGQETNNLPDVVKKEQEGHTNVTGVISFHGMYYYLNNDFKNKGYIPQSVLDNIDNSITVITNDGHWGNVETIMPNWGGITLPDINEVIEYKDRLGFADDGKGWWTRSLIAGAGYDYLYVKGSDPANYNATGSGFQMPWEQVYANIRPMMYLNKEFFKNVKIDLSKAGAEIKRTLRRVYSSNELSEAGYTPEELELYYTGESISNLEILGEMGFGCTLTASCTGDKNVSYEWQIADAVDGVYEAVSKEASYSPSATDNGKYIRLTAYASNGDKLVTEPLQIFSIKEDFAGTLSDVRIRGIFSAGNYLYTAYTLNDMTEDEISGYKWYVSDAENGEYTVAGNESSVKTEDVEQDKYYKCEITIADGSVYTTPVQKVNKLIWARWDNDGTQDPGDIDAATSELETAAFESDVEYMFTVDGHDFILLDTIETSDTARYMCITENTYGKHRYMDLDKESFTSQLPSEIVKHADKKVYRTGSLNGYWAYTLGGCVRYDPEYNGNFGFYPADIGDYVKYKNIVGMQAYNHNDYLTLDSPEPVLFGTKTNAVQPADRDMFALGVENDKFVIKTDCNNQWQPAQYYEVRPVFYLDKDFFTAVECEYKGSKVNEIIASAADGIGGL